VGRRAIDGDRRRAMRDRTHVGRGASDRDVQMAKGHTLPNLITLCEGHHLALHEGSLVIEGDATSARFIRVPQNKYKIETRVVECTAALRKRGVAKETIKAAVEATRTHVGRQDLTAQQWIDIALTKVSAPSHD
jgi:predicted GNAT family acetyltransferase